jgi:N-acyl-L-homoserine lactone synthetase
MGYWAGRGDSVATEPYFQALTFKVADHDQVQRALQLRSEIYAQELGDPGLDHFDHVASHLVAVDGRSGDIAAALRLVGPNHRPFDIEKFVPLTTLLPSDRRPSEASRFWVRREYRAVHRGQIVHLGMLKLLYEYAKQNGITDVIMLGLPTLTKLYRAAFFMPLDISLNHPTWGSTQVMRFDIMELQRKYQHSKSAVARLLLRTDMPNVVV